MLWVCENTRSRRGAVSEPRSLLLAANATPPAERARTPATTQPSHAACLPSRFMSSPRADQWEGLSGRSSPGHVNGIGDDCSETVKPWAPLPAVQSARVAPGGPGSAPGRCSGAEVVGLQPQHLDRLAGLQMLVEDRGHVRLGHPAVPDVVGHHQQARSRQAALHAAGRDHLHVLGQPAALLLAQLVEHQRRPAIQARPLRMPCWPLIETDKDVPFWLAVSAVVIPCSRSRAATSPTLAHSAWPRSAHGSALSSAISSARWAGGVPATSSATTGPQTTTSPWASRSSSRAALPARPRRRYCTHTEWRQYGRSDGSSSCGSARVCRPGYRRPARLRAH